jgi:hypothetical protein
MYLHHFMKQDFAEYISKYGRYGAHKVNIDSWHKYKNGSTTRS